MSPAPATFTPHGEKVLIVEDNRALRDGLALNIRSRGYTVLTADNGDEGLRLAFDARPDLIVLDIMLPGCNGLEILAALRKQGNRVPCLILSARDTTGNKVQGLTMGADDYMTKPFDLPELLARIDARLRRHREERESLPVLTHGDVAIDQAAREVRVGDTRIALSAKEFDLLCLLAASPGQVFTRDRILEQVWGWDYDGTARTVDNFVASLRKKLRRGKHAAECIATVPKVGYRFLG
jgi:two-component system, OmpR family, alkaline phosphatase synthesis response regulator PhoP